MRLTMAELADAIGVNLAGPVRDIVLCGISTDTRSLVPGDVFVALVGENFDGHSYLGEAVRKGASSVVVSRHTEQLAVPELLVPDTLLAYGAIAKAHRKRYDIPVIGITGSVGKSTTREMISCALGALGHVVRNESNENNEIGVPKTVLRIDENTAAAAIEMAMRGSGQIAYLASIAQPTVAVLTLISDNHIELLGSREAIAAAKAELVAAIEANGVVVLNGDDPCQLSMKRNTQATVVSYGFSAHADVHAQDVTATESGFEFRVAGCLGKPADVALKSAAHHDVANALAAITAAVYAGVSLADAADRLSTWSSMPMRMEVLQSRCGAVILNDCYNASPASMLSAVRTLKEHRATGRRIAYLGDMKELGKDAPRLHAEVAAFAVKDGDITIYSVGEDMTKALGGLQAGAFETSQEAAAHAAGVLDLNSNDVVLVKASRAMAMELVVEALQTR
jgi:UDP-N-acetylmuramoyl-tripeptide--D-alanyl-D-alanine ligase